MTKKDDKFLGFNYATKEDREKTATSLLQMAMNARVTVERDWKTFDNYYNGRHETYKEDDEEVSSVCEEIGLTDAYTQIESQIDTNLPEPIFRGRERSDSAKAKQREYVAKSIIYKNALEDKMTKNERQMRLYGDSFIKVYYDASADFDGNNAVGDIVIDCINTEDIFPDETAQDLNSCEYIDYVYRMHIRKAMRVWGDEIKKAGLYEQDISGQGHIHTTALGTSLTENEVEIQEHWYRDDDGDICCSVLINGVEIKHISKYWQKTRSQNKNYPFIHFYRLKSIYGFWNQSELKPIIPMVKAGDTILKSALTNMEFTSNDQIVCEEDALVEGEEITNEPGGIINVKAGRSGALKRLGGINKLGEFLTDIQFIQNEIQRTCRNYDTNQGAETIRQNTASGLAMLRADAASQSSIKDKDRLNAFKRLYQLIDWSALEFYDDDRLIYIGAPTARNRADMVDESTPENLDIKKGDVFFKFNSDKAFASREEIITQDDDAITAIEISNYFPPVDVEVNATAGLQKSKTYTIQALQAILQTPINQTNYKIVIAVIRELEIPQSEEIISDIELMYSPNRGSGNADLDKYLSQLNPQQQATLKSNPSLLNQVKELYSQNYGGMNYAVNGEQDGAGTMY